MKVLMMIKSLNLPFRLFSCCSLYFIIKMFLSSVMLGLKSGRPTEYLEQTPLCEDEYEYTTDWQIVAIVYSRGIPDCLDDDRQK